MTTQSRPRELSPGYVFQANGGGAAYAPAGKVEMSPARIKEHNEALEAAELAHWATRPDTHAVYVTDSSSVKTWLGSPIGTIVARSSHRNNIGATITAIRVRGTNGAEYYGRFGSDWSQLCRLRKCKGSK